MTSSPPDAFLRKWRTAGEVGRSGWRADLGLNAAAEAVAVKFFNGLPDKVFQDFG